MADAAGFDLYLRRGSDSISVTGISFDPTLQKFRHSFDLPEISLATAYEACRRVCST